jgi:ubiquinone/menaquinone biosynthesis C-methylase UbiE
MWNRCRSRLGPVGKVVGLDLNAGMLEIARSLTWSAPTPVEWHEANAFDLPFDDGYFDLVLCQQGLQFFPDRAAPCSASWRAAWAECLATHSIRPRVPEPVQVGV